MTTEFIYGKNSVEAILKNSERPINKLYILATIKRDNKINYILKIAHDNKIPVTMVSKDKMNKILGESVNHQGVIASVSPIQYADLDEIIEKSKTSKRLPLFVVLDNIEDPQNLGAIVRTAEVFGADGIIIPKRRSAPVTAAVAKASAGAIEYIPIIQVSNLVATINTLKDNGIWVFGAEFKAESKFVYDVDLNIPCALVMGSEGKGLSRLVKDTCDVLIKIPQLGKTNSLNVANALSIVLYEVIRQRGQDN